MAPSQATIDLPHKAYLLPQAIPMWPPAWWTWLALAIILMLAIGVLAFFYRRHKKRIYRREALSALTTASHELDAKACILQCHEMIRRCLISEGQHETAALPSSALLEKIDQSMPKKHRFSSLGADFVDGIYQQHIELTAAQRAEMLKVTRYWIRKHHA
jgi:cbb3-type cytochrome oxidase subunit 3